MSFSSTTNRMAGVAGNGVTTAFSFSYPFAAKADLVVLSVNDTTQVATTKTIDTHYTISGTAAGEGGYSSGTVTFLVAPASGTTIVIYRDTSPVQSLSLAANDALPAKAVELMFGKVVMYVQRLLDLAGRSVRLPEGFSGSIDLKLPVDIGDCADKIPTFNAGGTGFADVEDWPTATDVADAEENAIAAAASATSAAASAASALAYAVPTQYGTRGSPVSQAAASSISFTAGVMHFHKYVVGSGGAVSATLQAGTVVGQRALIIGTHDTNTVQVTHTNGACILGAQDTIESIWDGTEWVEIGRSN